MTFRPHQKICVLIVALSAALALRVAHAQDPLEDKDTADIVTDITESAGGKWWNAAWKYRRVVTIEDPKQLIAPGAIALPEPEPLLLYNTGRAQDGLADLRVVGPDGEPIPCGVANFGRDDDSSYIWCVPKAREGRKSLQLFVYYGNPAAAPTGDAAPPTGGAAPDKPVPGDPQMVRVGPETTEAGGASPMGEPGAFFKDVAVAEAESFITADAAKQGPWQWEDADGAAGGRLLVWKGGKTPVDVARTVHLDSGGTYRLHVRSRAGSGKLLGGPFTVLVNGKEIAVPGNGAGLNWFSTGIDLPAGEVKLALRASGPAAIDTILLTKDTHYRPDYRDINGPVLMRFKLQGRVPQPFYVDLFNMTTTFSATGSQGDTSAYLFRNRTVLPRKYQYSTEKGIIRRSEIPSYVTNLPKDPKNLLRGDEWTPWGPTFEHGSFTWYAQVRFLAAGRGKRPTPIRDVTVDYEFATRPDSTRVFRGGSIETGPVNYINIHMPARMDLDTLRTMTLTFSDWAKQRFAIAQSLGFKGGEGPKKIVLATTATTTCPSEAEQVLKTLDWIGLNTVHLRMPGLEDRQDILEKSGLTGTWSYSRVWSHLFETCFYREDSDSDKPPSLIQKKVMEPKQDGPLPGLGYGASVEKILADFVDEDYRKRALNLQQRGAWEFAHMRYNDLADEIGPAITSHVINAHPLFKGYFIEYLKAQGLQPGDLGAKQWEDIKAIDYTPALSATEEREEQVKRDEEAAARKQDDPDSLDSDPMAKDEPKKKKRKSTEVRAEQQATSDAMAAGIVQGFDPAQLDVTKLKATEKRVYYYTQKFRSVFTAMLYRHHANAVTKHFPAGVTTCANFQAMPAQSGQMWTGGLNIFDLGRQNGFTALQLEDWCWYGTNTRYGMSLLRAAARKNHQALTALVVGGSPGQRVMSDLMEGTRNFLFYLYGPVYSIGPVWAEDKVTQKDIGTTLRQVARAEPDILAAHNRPAPAAILVANTSEINSQYFKYPVGRERMAVYAALIDAQVPVELVGEEEVIEDNALARYKILYVTDPHVDSRAQKKIKEWVAAGGTLWADYGGLARQEFDEPSRLFDEVFGLTSRGDIKPYVVGAYGMERAPLGPAITVPKSALFAADKIEGIEFRPKPNELSGFPATPAWKVGTAKVLATFATGAPAIVQNKFGKGQAFLCGFLAGQAYAGSGGPYTQSVRSHFSSPTRAQYMTVPANLAGVVPHVRLGRLGVSVSVHDGPAQTVVFLVNTADGAVDAPLEVALPKTPQSAYSGSGRPVDYKMAGTTATVPLKMEKGATEILVFKY